jgi:hypothetical protein
MAPCAPPRRLYVQGERVMALTESGCLGVIELSEERLVYAGESLMRSMARPGSAEK